jgi:hypothetical protein
MENLATGIRCTFAIRAVTAAGSVSDWVAIDDPVTTDGVQNPSPVKNTRPSGIKVGNNKNGASKATINTIELALPTLPAGSTYHIEVDASKLRLPKNFTWQGVSYANTPTGRVDFVAALDMEIRIENGKAIISGLPAGMRFTFNVRTIDAGNQFSAVRTVSATTAKFVAPKGVKMSGDRITWKPYTLPLGVALTDITEGFVYSDKAAMNPTSYKLMDITSDGATLSSTPSNSMLPKGTYYVRLEANGTADGEVDGVLSAIFKIRVR